MTDAVAERHSRRRLVDRRLCMGRLALVTGHGQSHKVEIKNAAALDAISHAHSSFPSSGSFQPPQSIGSVSGYLRTTSVSSTSNAG